jgi:putative SOS response-associated peptidase YedK
MCGRYSLITRKEDLARYFNISPASLPGRLEPRYNIAPTQPILVLRRRSAGSNRREDAPAPEHGSEAQPAAEPALASRNAGGELRADLFRWGLIPAWTKEVPPGNQMINARREGLTEKPSFRDSFRFRRCLVPADGFYEWLATDPRRAKTPHYIRLKSGEPFTFAGLWARWRSPAHEDVYSCTIITGEPNELVRRVHDRMPVIVRAENRDAWLDPEHRNEAELLALLQTYDAGEMEMIRVSRYVSSPDNEGDECIRPDLSPESPIVSPRGNPARARGELAPNDAGAGETAASPQRSAPESSAKAPRQRDLFGD